MTRLVILGAHGQVGGALAARVRQAGMACDAFGRAECDITDPVALKRRIGAGHFVINCAAYTAVDQAETEVEAAYRVNATGAENVATACAEAGVPLVHLSTDYVLDGESQKPAREDDPPRPLNVYGQSKLAGEIAVRQRVGTHIILRSSWIFSARGKNFVKTILGLAKTQSQLRVVDDQIGGPTPADDVAKAILDIIAVSTKPGFQRLGDIPFQRSPAGQLVRLRAHHRRGQRRRGAARRHQRLSEAGPPSVELAARLQPDLAGIRNQAAGLASRTG